MLNYIKVLDDGITFELSAEPDEILVHYLDDDTRDKVKLYYDDILKLDERFSITFCHIDGTIVYASSKADFAEWVLEKC